MKRRTFIQSGSMLTLPIFLRGMEVTAIAKSSLMSMIGPDNDKILVLVQLNGGNDGLNTFIPLDQYANLMKVRSTLLLPEDSVLKANDTVGFHPSMTGFKSLYDDGMMAVIQGVSYPNQNRSHFRSTDIWTSASASEDYISTGWLGRHLDLNYPGYPNGYPNDEYPDPFCITLGYIVSETCQGASSNYSYAVSGTNLISLVETEDGEYENTCYGMELSFIKETVKQSNAYTDAVGEAFDKGMNSVDYPDGSKLGDQLKIVANLISGGLKTKIYVVSLGGFDTHASQVLGDETLRGNHADLLAELSDSITAFQTDINNAGYGEKVVGMTFSEFGRRIKANDSLGTDHGTAAPLFVFGNCVNAGVFGENAQISDNVDEQEGVPMQYDFRSIYASILMDWFGASASDVQTVLFKDFQYIPFIKDCQSSTSSEDHPSYQIEAKIYPNPCHDITQLSFQSSGILCSVDLFDVRGGHIKTFFSRKLSVGDQSISLNFDGVTSGPYFIRIAEGNKQKTLKIVKM